MEMRKRKEPFCTDRYEKGLKSVFLYKYVLKKIWNSERFGGFLRKACRRGKLK